MTFTVLKIPFDLGIIDKERRGAKLAPDLLAKGASVPVSEDLNLLQESISAAAIPILKKDKLLAIGGDHSITFHLATAFKQLYPNSCLIILDAHSDCEDDFIPPSHEGVTRALATTAFSPSDILLIGYRRARTKEEKEFIQKHKIKTIAPKDINGEVILSFIKNYGAAYLSIDIDVFDKDDVPGTGWPEENGPKKEVILNLIEKLSKSERLKSVDLVEVSPPLDSTGKTAALASDLIKLFTTPKG